MAEPATFRINGMCLDTKGITGGAISTQPCDDQSVSQVLYQHYQNDGSVMLESMSNPGYCLDTGSSVLTNNSLKPTINQCSNQVQQHWFNVNNQLKPAEDTTFCIDDGSNGFGVSGSLEFSLCSAPGFIHQNWVTSSYPPSDGKNNLMVNGLCYDGDSNTTEYCNGKKSQEFIYSNNSEIKYKNSCLDATSLTPGFTTCNNSTNQQWTLNTENQLIPVGRPNYCLDNNGTYGRPGLAPVLGACQSYGSLNQSWVLNPVTSKESLLEMISKYFPGFEMGIVIVLVVLFIVLVLAHKKKILYKKH
jgi:hypothetical protein